MPARWFWTSRAFPWLCLPRRLAGHQVDSLVAEVELGLRSAHTAADAEDPWLALRERLKANQTYIGVRQITDRSAMPRAAHANLERRLAELRVAVHGASLTGSMKHAPPPSPACWPSSAPVSPAREAEWDSSAAQCSIPEIVEAME
jgi:hypothetical protein